MIPGVRTVARAYKMVAMNAKPDRFCAMLTAFRSRWVMSTATAMLSSHLNSLIVAMSLKRSVTFITVRCASVMTFQEEV